MVLSQESASTNFRSLGELTHDFLRRQSSAGVCTANSNSQLGPLLDGTRLSSRFRSLVELTQDFQERQAVTHEQLSDENSIPPLSSFRSYTRNALLQAGAASTSLASEKRVLGIYTVARDRADRLCTKLCSAEDPRLDDMALLAALEARLSRESGADAKNHDTFGPFTSTWSFEMVHDAEALELPNLMTRRSSHEGVKAFIPVQPFEAESVSTGSGSGDVTPDSARQSEALVCGCR